MPGLDPAAAGRASPRRGRRPRPPPGQVGQPRRARAAGRSSTAAKRASAASSSDDVRPARRPSAARTRRWRRRSGQRAVHVGGGDQPRAAQPRRAAEPGAADAAPRRRTAARSRPRPAAPRRARPACPRRRRWWPTRRGRPRSRVRPPRPRPRPAAPRPYERGALGIALGRRPAGAGRRPARSPRTRCRPASSTEPGDRAAQRIDGRHRRPARPAERGRQHVDEAGPAVGQRPQITSSSRRRGSQPVGDRRGGLDRADSVPANLSGQTSTRTPAESAAGHTRRRPRRRPVPARCGTIEGVTTFAEPSGTATALLLLGRGTDPDSERGVDCPGDLPAPSDPDPGRPGPRGQGGAGRPGVRPRPPLPARRGHPVRRRDRRLVQAGPRGRGPARRGVHRVLRRALHGRERRHPHLATRSRSILPDLAAGCSMADMAAIGQVETAWDVLDGRSASPSRRCR